MAFAVRRLSAVPTAKGRRPLFVLSLAAICVVRTASSAAGGRCPYWRRVMMMLRFAVAVSSSAMVAQCSFLLPSGPGCLLRGYRRSCLASAGSRVSPVLGGGLGGSALGFGCVFHLKRARKRERSSGLVVHFGGAVIVAVIDACRQLCVVWWEVVGGFGWSVFC